MGDPLKHRDRDKVSLADAAAAVDKRRKERAANDPGDVAKYAQRIRDWKKKQDGPKVWQVGIELKTSKNPCSLCGKPMPKRRKTPICVDCLEALNERREQMKGEMANGEN